MIQESIEYKLDDLVMEGYFARNESDKPQPMVLVVHDWSGNRAFAQEKAQYFAKQGMLGFAVDLYGKGKRGSDTDKTINQKLLEELLADRKAILNRLQAALDCVKQFDNVDASSVMAIGFCMGGLCVLDFARSNADIKGVISVHGILTAPEYPTSGDITPKILALHGHEDKMVSPQDILEFEQEMTARKADWQMHTFGSTMHAFTNPKADDPDLGLKYSALNAGRTWRLVDLFAQELFGL